MLEVEILKSFAKHQPQHPPGGWAVTSSPCVSTHWSSILEKSAHVPKSSGEDLGVERLLCLLGGWEPGLHRLLGAFPLSWTEAACGPPNRGPRRGALARAGGAWRWDPAGAPHRQRQPARSAHRRWAPAPPAWSGSSTFCSTWRSSSFCSSYFSSCSSWSSSNWRTRWPIRPGRSSPGVSPCTGSLGASPASKRCDRRRAHSGGRAWNRAGTGPGLASILWSHGRPGSRAKPCCLAGRSVWAWELGKWASFSAPPGSWGLTARWDVRDDGCLGSGLVVCF